MLKRTSLLLLAALLLMPAIASADTASVARDTLKANINASVELSGTMNARAEGEGAAKVRVPSKKVATRGVVLDASGLAVCSLTKINPLSGGKKISVRGMTLTLRGEVEGLSMRLSDGTTVPARIVLTDATRDLAFIAPSTPLNAKQASAVTAVSLETISAQILDEIVIIARGSKSTGYAPMASITRIASVISKPTRRYYAAASTGSMVFTASGKFLGIAVVQKNEATINASSGRAAISATPVILPGSEIKPFLAKALEAAKKAPAAKPAPKPAPKPAEPTEPSGPAPGEV